jgi:hypothetical protein
MRGAPIEPNEDAIDLGQAGFARRFSRNGPAAQQINEPKTEHAAQPELEKIPSSHACAVIPELTHSYLELTQD